MKKFSSRGKCLCGGVIFSTKGFHRDVSNCHCIQCLCHNLSCIKASPAYLNIFPYEITSSENIGDYIMSLECTDCGFESVHDTCRVTIYDTVIVTVEDTLNVSLITQVDLIEENELRVWNEANTIYYEVEEQGDFEVIIFNNNAQILHSIGNFTQTRGQFNMSQQPSGLYFITINDNQTELKSETRKIVIQ